MGKELILQNTIQNSIVDMDNELTSTLLPVTNLLSKAKGNINVAEYFDESSIKPVLNYHIQNNNHVIELIFLNPIYSVIDCSGEILNNINYPIKINLIWQLIVDSTSTQNSKQDLKYDLICERYNNYKLHEQAIDPKNIYRTTLLRNINLVKFKFVEQLSSGNIRSVDLAAINAKSLPNQYHINLVAVQIGMIVQSPKIVYKQPCYSWYNVFDDRRDFFDQYQRKVIYITTNSNLT